MTNISGNGNVVIGGRGGTVTVNGKTYRGKNVRIQNDVVYVDGKPVGEGASTAAEGGILHIEVTGDVGSIESDQSVTVNGNVQGSVNAGGSVNCGSVGGDVDAGGSVSSDSIGGDVDAGGSVRAVQIQGSVDAGGSVRTT